MLIAVIGGTGRTGQQFVEQAARAGHGVRALARRPGEARDAWRDLAGVEVVPGDLRDPASVARLVGGAGAVDVVVSAAGPVRGGAPDDLQVGAGHVVAAMEASGVRRLVWMTGAGVRFPVDRPGAVDRLVVGVMSVVARRTLADSRAAVARVTGSSLDWTVVRAPRLVDGPAVDEPTVVPGVGHGAAVTASRATVARVLLESAGSGAWLHAAPVVSD